MIDGGYVPSQSTRQGPCSAPARTKALGLVGVDWPLRKPGLHSQCIQTPAPWSRMSSRFLDTTVYVGVRGIDGIGARGVLGKVQEYFLVTCFERRAVKKSTRSSRKIIFEEEDLWTALGFGDSEKECIRRALGQPYKLKITKYRYRSPINASLPYKIAPLREAHQFGVTDDNGGCTIATAISLIGRNALR